MSVLSFPRIYFNGYMGWDPATGNNNDYQPIYDASNAALNFEYLSTFGPSGPTGPLGPTGASGTYTSSFRNWAISGEPDSCPGPSASWPPPTIDTSSDCVNPPQYDICHMSSRWNYYGGNECWLVDYPAGGKRTLTTGGYLAYKQPAGTGDAILNKPVVITGNTFGGRPSNARLIDINPYCPWSSQIFFGNIRVGDDQTFLAAQRYMRMHMRLSFVPRTTANMLIAGVMGVVFQTTFPNNLLQSNAANSPLLQALLAAMQQPGAQGLMLRFTVFSTLYYQNGVFNNNPPVSSADQLEKMYRQGMVFRNPAYSTVVGTFGVWNQGELTTAPSGHMLVSANAPSPAGTTQSSHFRQIESVDAAGHGEIRLTEILVPNPDAPAELADADALAAADAATASAPPATLFGTAFAELGATGNIISLDLGNTIPDVGPSGPKYNYGPISLGVAFGPTSFTPVGTFSNYDWNSYMQSAGIVDVPLQGVTTQTVRQWLKNGGSLALKASGATASVEQEFWAETDSRGVYLDECNSTQMTVQVRYQNGTPPAGTKLLLAQYYPWGLNTAVGQWQYFGASPPSGQTGVCAAVPTGQYVNFPGASGPTAVVPVTIPQLNGATAPYGEATVTLQYNQPGFPVIAFYPFTGPTPPTPQAQVGLGGPANNSYIIGTAHYSNVRTMPADNALLQEFVDCWNATGSYAGTTPYDRLQTWNFVYSNILYVYDALFPVMDQYMPLGILESVEAAVDQLVTMIAAPWVDDSTLYMPVTRDLSAAKRLILLTWGDLINRKYPQQPLQPLNVPCD